MQNHPPEFVSLVNSFVPDNHNIAVKLVIKVLNLSTKISYKEKILWEIYQLDEHPCTRRKCLTCRPK
jgi:hypothetical protein